MFGCGAFYSRKDGFNYHASGRLKTYEEGCTAQWNGVWINEVNAPKNNNSTIHDGGTGVRVNGNYRFGQHRCVHDVTAGTYVYNVGCVAGDSQRIDTGGESTDASAAFSFGLFNETSTGAKAWYVGCSSFGSTKFDLQVSPGATATLIDSTFANVQNNGTIVDANDVTVPTLLSVSVSGAVVSLNYSEPLDATSLPAGTAFTITPSKTASAVSIAGSTVSVTASSTYLAGETGSISYSLPATGRIRDIAGNNAAAFPAQPFTAPGGGGYTPTDENVLAFKDKVDLAGGSVSTAEYQRLEALATALKTAGVWDQIVMLWAPVGLAFTTALRALKYPGGVSFSGTQLTSFGHVSTDWDRTIGLDGRSADGKYLDTGVSTNTVTSVSSHMALVVESPVTSGLFRDMGVWGPNDMQLLCCFTDGTTSFDKGFYRSPTSSTNLELVNIGTPFHGVYVGTRLNANSAFLKDGAVLASSTSASGSSTPNLNYNIGRARSSYGRKIVKGGSVGFGLTTSQAQSLSSAFAQFRINT